MDILTALLSGIVGLVGLTLLGALVINFPLVGLAIGFVIFFAIFWVINVLRG